MERYEFISPVEDRIVELSNNRFRKQILRRGSFRHPQIGKQSDHDLVVDDKFLDATIRNFNNGAVDDVHYIKNHNEEDVSDVYGTVIALEKTEEGLDGIFEIPDDEVRRKLLNKSLPRGVSAGLSFSPVESEIKGGDGKDRIDGPVLRHVAATIIPWVKGLEDWSPSEAVEAEKLLMSDGHKASPVFYKGAPTMEELDTAVKLIAEQKGMDSAELSKLLGIGTAEEPKEESKEENELFKQLTAFLSDQSGDNKDATEDKEEKNVPDEDAIAKLIDDRMARTVTPLSDVLKKVVENITAVGEKNSALEKTIVLSDAEQAVKPLVAEGKITPAEKEHYEKLFMSDKELFEGITKSLAAKVTFDDTESDESGPFQMNGYTGAKLTDDAVKENIDRYVKMVKPLEAGKNHEFSGLQIGGR